MAASIMVDETLTARVGLVSTRLPAWFTRGPGRAAALWVLKEMGVENQAAPHAAADNQNR
ncbi:hypothetical protein NIM87_11525 [Devosia sp. XJ19-1]|uniref:Uncharacterized protein n=1 Tax=Devosia ureilytica TaxID=2952754 RepID=A0A9Q4AP14_9HYPH|nr:hypothetical protein [Devosia ureilytica]MCP8884135.1 hypothetical protein [Devosia ureilytica]MCP8887743.1 hypothetical protein [Devosia ureilytica]